MIATGKRLANAVRGRPAVQLALQVGVSIALILLLLRVAGRADLAAALGRVRPGTVALAAGLYVAAWSLNAWRWQRLLGYLGVREPLGRLNALYFIGNFCSLFLPTSAGGDAYRVYEVARRGNSPLRVLLATLQERLMGLGMTMCVGLAATLYYRALLPPSLFWAAALLQGAGVLGVAALLYPGPALRLAGRLSRSRLAPAPLRRLPRTGPGARLANFLRPLREAAPMTARQILPVLALALVTFLLVAVLYGAVGRALGVRLGVPACWCHNMPHQAQPVRQSPGPPRRRGLRVVGRWPRHQHLVGGVEGECPVERHPRVALIDSIDVQRQQVCPLREAARREILDRQEGGSRRIQVRELVHDQRERVALPAPGATTESIRSGRLSTRRVAEAVDITNWWWSRTPARRSLPTSR
jgi:uncharacterized membrane protein YbhN (UPF0104 family)